VDNDDWCRTVYMTTVDHRSAAARVETRPPRLAGE
jgi:hypothetical protein